MRCFFLFTFLLANATAQAYVVNGSMGRDPNASMGQCLPIAKPSVSEAKDLIQFSKLNVSENARDEELVALAWGLKQAISLRDKKPLQGMIGAKIVYTDEGGVWNESKGYVEVNRKWNTQGMNSQNIGMLFHELAHYLGNNRREDNMSSYLRYFQAVPSGCCFSWYCNRNRNEEFAEVFSSFLLNPANLLKEGGPNCKAAYDFFRKNVFPFGDLADCKPSASKKL